MKALIPKNLVALTLLLGMSAWGANDDFLRYKQQQNQEFTRYQKDVADQFQAYKKAQQEGLAEFKKELRAKWKKPEVSTRYKWVEYSKDLSERKSIDFAKQMMRLEVHAKNQQEAMQKLHKMFEDTMREDLKEASKRDLLEHKIAKKLHKKILVHESKTKIIPQKVVAQYKRKLVSVIRPSNIKRQKYNDNFIYSVQIKLPNPVMARNAMRFQGDIVRESKREQIPVPLIYAVIHSESAFNPMARSYVPAFGLMQIVPKTAGVDAYKYLYGYKKMLSASYLYSPGNNIRIGTAYLHILYYNYLRKIRNPQSRLYCTIAAYNTGAGNVFRAFSGSSRNSKAALARINALSPDEVYETLLAQLPYDETKHYLKVVNKRRLMYEKIFEKRG